MRNTNVTSSNCCGSNHDLFERIKTGFEVVKTHLICLSFTPVNNNYCALHPLSSEKC